jgi:hypothetical protein
LGQNGVNFVVGGIQLIQNAVGQVLFLDVIRQHLEGVYNIAGTHLVEANTRRLNGVTDWADILTMQRGGN